MVAFNSSFQSAIPGSSIGHHKLGELPHERPPQYTDPDQALHYFWKKLTTVDAQRQIWDVLKMKGADCRTVAKALLYKAALDGIIQVNLGIVIFPVVHQMIDVIAKSGGVKAKFAPDRKDPLKEKKIQDNLKALMLKYDKNGHVATVLKGSKGAVSAPNPTAQPNASSEPGQPSVAPPQKSPNIASNPAQTPVHPQAAIQAQQAMQQGPAPNPTQQPVPASGIMGFAQQPQGR